MLHNTKFLKHRVERALAMNGQKFSFIPMLRDEYNQLKQSSTTIEVFGMYHEQNSFISVTSSDAASVQRKKSPMILTLLDDNVKKLKQGDVLFLGDTRYTVSGILDIQNWGIVADISLEMVV